MKIRTKFTFGFLVVTLIFFVFGFISANKSQEILRENIGINSATLASEALNKIDRSLFSRIEEMQLYAKDHLLFEELERSNKEYGQLGDVQEYIDNKDKEWRSFPGDSLSPFMRQIQSKGLSYELVEKIDFYKAKYGYLVLAEMFVTNKYGANAAQTGKTSDFRQDDEEWWQLARQHGLWISEPGFDKSAGVHSIDICLRVDDHEGNFLGVMKSVLNIVDILTIVTEMLPGKNMPHAEMPLGHEEHASMKIRLITHGRQIIASTDHAEFLTTVPEQLFARLQTVKGPSFFTYGGMNPGKDEKLFSHAHSEGYRDFQGLDWILVLEHSAAEVFQPVNRLWSFLMILLGVVTVVAIVFGMAIANSVVSPIITLKDKMLEVGAGSLDTTIDISSKDEVGSLARSFRDMLDNLGKSTASIEELNGEITERKAMQEALLKSENRFKDVAHISADWIWEVDQNGKYTYASGKVEEVLGYRPEELLGKTPFDLMTEQEQERAQEYFQEIIAEKKPIVGFENWNKSKNGESVCLLTEGIPMLDTHGNLLGYRGIDKNITDEKNAETEKKKMQGIILQQEKLASIGQLAAGVAHEINNPMGFITSNMGTLDKYLDRLIEFIDAQTESLQSDDAEDQIQELRKKLKIDFIIGDIKNLLDESVEGSKRVTEIVQNLKGFSRVDTASSVVQSDINDCIESTIKIIWNELKYKCTVHKEFSQLPLTFCNPKQLNQVFINLMINAAHSIEDKGDLIIKTLHEDNSIKVSITDTGKGISPENVSRIFDPFFTTKEIGEGTGLGLSICYDIIASHDGTIDVASEVEKGTTFTVGLPVKEKAG